MVAAPKEVEMKRQYIILGSLLVLLLFCLHSIPVHAANGEFDLALRSLESRPTDIRVGQETFFSITYENRGSSSVPAEFETYIMLMVTAQETNELIQQCSEQVTSVAGLEPGAIQTFVFQSCDVIFRLEGPHTLRAAFVPSDQLDDVAQTGSYLPLANDADATNNGTTITVEVKPYESALPAELGRLFAGLGMFFAVMAIVAVGTEVVIDSVKVSLGMKSKITSLDAMAKMEQYLPDKLATLGITAASRTRFRELTTSMRRTVTPVSEIPNIIDEIKRGEFEAAAARLEQFGLERSDIQGLLDDLKVVQETAVTELSAMQNDLSQLLKNLTQRLAPLKNWPLLTLEQQAFLQDLEDRLRVTATKLEALQLQVLPDDISDLDEIPTNVQEVANQLRSLVSDWHILLRLLAHEMQNWSAQATVNWLSDKRNDLLTQGKQHILLQFDQEVAPQLDDLDNILQLFGYEADQLIQKTRQQLTQVLNSIETETVTTTDAYLASLEQLLQGVEDRRNLMQSPARKLWRRLRESAHSLVSFAISAGALVLFVESLFNLTIVGQALLRVYDINQVIVRVGGALIDGVLLGIAVWIVLAVLSGLGQWAYRKMHNGRSPTKRTGPINALDNIEILWNWLRGASMEPDTFGSAEVEKAKVQNLTLESLAKVVFERSDQQRDEESSRLRWLRVISVITGFAIAYVLQIDAAELLDAAVPGIANTINRVFYISGDHLHAWQSWLSSERAITAGIILTGFAAAAGSTFWHDRLDQLQAAKKGAESVAKTIQQAERLKNLEE